MPRPRPGAGRQTEIAESALHLWAGHWSPQEAIGRWCLWGNREGITKRLLSYARKGTWRDGLEEAELRPALEDQACNKEHGPGVVWWRVLGG